MIQVHYRWRVEPTNRAEFERARLETTKALITNREGARGSILLEQQHAEAEILQATAMWTSETAWNNSRGRTPPPSTRTEEMRAYSELVAVKASTCSTISR